jgi:hypothetical protein
MTTAITENSFIPLKQDQSFKTNVRDYNLKRS